MLSKRKSSTLFLLMLVLSFTIQAQVFDTVPMRQVLGSAGGTATVTFGNTPYIIDYTVGEVVVTTDSLTAPFSIRWLTQGFQQPENSRFSVEEFKVNSTCIGANNGSVNLSAINNSGTVTYNWNNNGFGAQFLFTDLAPGNYPYIVKDASASYSGTVHITEDQVDCTTQLVVYKGITPNGDNHNDNWQIDGITNFEKNSVTIYNRWGDLIWSAVNYNNQSVVWAGTNKSGNPLPDATYFYIIELNGKICKECKGWVEVSH